MGLALALYENSDFYVQDVRVSIHKIYHSKRFKVMVHGVGVDKIYEITDRQQTEILPNVRLSAGNNVNTDTVMVKAVISAPKTLKILRGKLYRKSKKIN